MKLFLSWSGEESKQIAEFLSEWLEQVLQAVDTWMSSEIDKGKRWSAEISSKLEESKVCIICLTQDNLDSPWIHFEAGAISKTSDAFVCTFLFDITPTTVKQPLSQFQATKFEKADVLKLVKSINSKLSEIGEKSLKEVNLENIFSIFWPKLEEKLKGVSKTVNAKNVIRSDRELIEESLELLRSIKGSSIMASSEISDANGDEYLDWLIDVYCKSNDIPLTSIALKGHEDKIAKQLGHYRSVLSVFGSFENLKKRIHSRIANYLPF
jgi:hypothetical protein